MKAKDKYILQLLQRIEHLESVEAGYEARLEAQSNQIIQLQKRNSELAQQAADAETFRRNQMREGA